MNYQSSRSVVGWSAAVCVALFSAVVWRPTPARAQTYSAPVTLYTFSGPDGEFPNGGLTIDSQGNLYGATALGGPQFSFLNGGNDGFGTIYKFSPATGSLSTLASFDGLDGFKPQSRVSVDGQGNLWGSTLEGGVDWIPPENHEGWGTVWEISNTGVFNPGVVEVSGPDGAIPIGDLTFDAQGNLWGATNQGGLQWDPGLGNFANGTLFQVPPGLVRSNPALFIAPAIPSSGPTFDSQGNIFGTMTDGGVNGQGSLYELSAGGQLSTLFSFDKATSGQSPNAVTIDANGNVYGTTQNGGAFGFGTLWKYSAAGGLTTLVNFNGANGRIPIGAVNLDANGNLFGVTVNGGANDDGVIYEYSSTGVLSTVLTFDGTNNGSNPENNVIFDSQGNLYGTTDDGGSNGRGIIYMIKPVSTTLTVTSVSVSPSSLQGGSTTQGTVTLSGPAPAGGVPVVLGSSNSSIAAPEGPVTVPAGATSAPFTIVTEPVVTNTNVAITANLGSSAQQTSLTLAPPPTVALEPLSINPDSVQGGVSSTGTVTLNELAPAGGVVVGLSSNNSAASVPSSVAVPAGSLSANFAISTQPTTSTVDAAITATLGGTSRQASILVTDLPPITVGALSVSPTTVTGSSHSTGIVGISRQAPAGGIVVSLSSTGPVTVPASVTVPAGVTNASFPIPTQNVTANSSATITASLNGGSLQTQLTIVPSSSVTLASFGLSAPGEAVSNGSASNIVGGFSSQGILNLNGPAPAGGVLISLSSSSPLASVPPSVSIPEGNTTTSFAIATDAVTSNTIVNLTATLGTNVQQASLEIAPPNPGSFVSSFTLNPASVTGGDISQATVTLNGPAPSGGTNVTFTSNSAAASITPSITIPAGSSSATVAVTTQGVAAVTTANLFADTTGEAKEAILTINPGTATLSVASVTLNPTSVQGGGSSTGTVTLSAPAPASGALVSLSSNNAAASTPASVTVAPGSTSASFTVNTTAVNASTTAGITASLNGSSAQATLTITPVVGSSLTSLTLNPSTVRSGDRSVGTVTLSGPAPAGGAVITLSSSNTSVATVPSTVTIAAGSSSQTFRISTVRSNSNQTATISASYNAVTKSAVLTVTKH